MSNSNAPNVKLTVFEITLFWYVRINFVGLTFINKIINLIYIFLSKRRGTRRYIFSTPRTNLPQNY